MLGQLVVVHESLQECNSGFGGLGVACCLLSTQVRRFKPGRSRQDFSGRKNPQHAFLQKGSKAVVPMSQICGT